MGTWVPVLVRLEDLSAVTELIAKLEAGRATDADGREGDDALEPVELVTSAAEDPAEGLGASGLAELDARGVWSVRDLRRLAASGTATGQRWARAMDVCAEVAGTYLPTSEVARRAGMGISEWRDAPRKISRHLKAHYPDVPKDEQGNAYWPLSARSLPEHPGEVSWAMSQELARRWKQVRDAEA